MRSMLAALLLGFFAAPAAAQDRPLVVELFTSQGCEACPSANRMMGRIARDENVIALTYPVDLWDYLGWRDTFAQPAFSRRQRAYARALEARRLSTPQLVFDGEVIEAGPPADRVHIILNRLRAAPPSSAPAIYISPSNNAVDVRVGRGAHQGPPADVWLASFDPGPVFAEIGAGENRGKHVPHYNLVRRITWLGDWRGASKRYAGHPCSPACAVIVQEANGGHVIAAARFGSAR